MRRDYRGWWIGMIVCVLLAGVACGPPEDGDDIVPGPRKIIIVKPGSDPNGNTILEWGVDGQSATKSAEESTKIHADVFREIEKFEVFVGEDFMANLSEVTLKIQEIPDDPEQEGAVRTLVVKKVNGDFDWILEDASGNEITLTKCNGVSGDPIPDCKTGSKGIPTEFFGKLLEINGVVIPSGTFPTTTWSKVRMITPET
jgi:hypothetical protein